MSGSHTPSTQSHWKRYQKVIGVLIKYGFEDVVSHPPFNRFRSVTNKLAPLRGGKSVLEYTRYERIRMVCEELGTTYIKFAQIASNRPDILPEELIHELTKFQDHALSVSKVKIYRVLTKEFKEPLSDYFEYIDYNPIASASIAQVHRARIIGGKEVVLKIQRPDISANIKSDIAILKSLAAVISQYFPQYEAFQPKELVKMFEVSILKELKFTTEAANIIRFQKQFAKHPDVYLPAVYPEYTTDKVLCMEYIDGFKITDLKAIEESTGLTGTDLALKGIGLYFEQVFEHGFFHADPHPGNIFVMKDTGQICFIDFGMMGFVLEKDQERIADLLLAISHQDVQGLKKSFLEFAVGNQLVKEQELEQDIVEFFANYETISLDVIDTNEVMKGLNSLFFDYKIKIPSNLLLLIKAMLIIEGVGLELDPKYNIVKNIDPYANRLLLKKFVPEKLKESFIKSFFDFSRLFTDFPEDIAAIFKKIKKGKLHVEFEHKGLQPLLHKMEIVSNRISFTLLLSALILGSSWIITAKIPPYIYNVSLIGFVGFVLSGILAFRLLYSIIKHGNF
ncbi:MAG: ubiquinone biosynthesis protein [Saprospiraceae bacterium]|jgi:ubiquinone biosynthesis protein